MTAVSAEPDFAVPARTAPVPATAAGGLAPARDRADAEAFTRALAHGHYENFSVVSKLLPQRLRQHFCNVYAFCRIADDLGDEMGDKAASLRLLEQLKQQTAACYAGAASTKLFLGLRGTIEAFDIPIDPFLHLIDAFEQDQRVARYDTLPQVVDYCTRSADPVGRLVLYMCGYRDASRQQLSDRICTALQLANFWQDVRRDKLERDRIYIPKDCMARHGITEQQITSGTCTDGYRQGIRELVEYTNGLFAQGAALLPTIARAYRSQITLFLRGGEAVLDAIGRQKYDTLSRRPKISRRQKLWLMAPVLVNRILPGGKG